MTHTISLHFGWTGLSVVLFIGSIQVEKELVRLRFGNIVMFDYLRRYSLSIVVPDLQKPANSWHPLLFALVAAASMTLMLNGPFYAALQTQLPGQYRLQMILIFIVFLLNLTLILLLGYSRFLKPLVLILFLAGSVSLYFNQAFGVLIDRDMLQNAVETDPGEAQGLISAALILHLLQWMSFPLLLVSMVRVQRLARRTYWQQHGAAMLLVIVTFTLIGATQYAELASFFRNFRSVKHLALPVSPVIAAISLAVKSVKAQVPTEFQIVASDATRTPTEVQPKLLVLVVGETARADHFQLNGYKRSTNPLLSKLPVVSFSKVSSCGTATAHSLPCMFSALTRETYDEKKAKHSSNVLDILQMTGMDVSWLDNNSGCKGVCDRLRSEFLFQQPDPRCQNGQCLDDVLLDGLSRELSRKPGTDRVIVLHQLGSHGPEYYKRSAKTDKVFVPECQDKQLQLCTRAEIINAYDNSIIATDRLLASVIQLLERQEHYNAAMLYISDHGESLGENGIYLHGLPYFMAPEAQTHIPMIWWMSSGYSDSSKLDSRCVADKRNKSFSHDNLFDTLLGAFAVNTIDYSVSLDIFNSCEVSDANTEVQ